MLRSFPTRVGARFTRGTGGVQTKLRKHVDKSGTMRGRLPGAGARPYLVSGLLKCGECSKGKP
jgi:hypothetical protein